MSITDDRIGDVELARGNLAGALASYQASFGFRERLAKAQPDRLEWRRALKVSYDNIGAVELQQGNLPVALVSYQAGLAIMEKMATSDAANGDVQWQLAAAYDRVGNVQMAQGDVPAALTSYRAQFAVMERLAKSDAANAEWQRDLFVACVKLGDAQAAQGDLPAALSSYQSGVTAIEPLAKSNPGNAGWQRDRLTAYLRVGQALFHLGRVDEALGQYDAAIAIGNASDRPGIYLRRAVAEIESDRADAAVKDMATALQLDRSDAYNLLWLHVARLHAGKPDVDEFAAYAKQIDRSKWPAPVVALFSDSMNIDAVKDAAASAEPPNGRIGRACEADFFIGEYQMEKAGPASARPSFQSAVDHCPHGYFEYSAARFELKRLDALAGAQQNR
jgi:tetratricopeptide (TPR) repeat protein